MYCAMIGDLIGSKKLLADEREAVQNRLRQLLDEMNTRFSEYLASPFLVTLGDEFQGLLTAAEPALEIIEYIDRGLARHQVRMRYGLGLGGISTGPVNRVQALGDDGPAYHRAREGVDILKESEWRGFPVSIRTKQPDEALLQAICQLLNDMTEDWSAVQRQYVLDMELLGEQLLAAEKNGVSQSSISRALKRGHYRTYQQTKETLKQYLLSTYDCPESAGRLGRYNWAASLERRRKCEEAIPILEALLEAEEKEENDPPSRGDVLFLLSKCRKKMGELSAAVEAVNQAIQWEKERRETTDRRVSELHRHLGECYLDLAERAGRDGLEASGREWAQKAVSVLEYALSLCQKMPALQADVSNDLALAYGEAESLAKEINIRLKLQKWMEERQVQTEEIYTNLHNLSCAYDGCGEQEKALSAAEKAVQLAEQMVIPKEGLGRLYDLYASLLFEMRGTSEEVLSCARKALVYYKRDDDLRNVQHMSRFLRKIYDDSGNAEAASWAVEQQLRAERALRKREEEKK